MRQALSSLLILLMLLCFAVSDVELRAQDSAKTLTLKANGHRWAVLIGVDDYIQAKHLKYCGADMRALRDRLVASGFPEKQVKLLHDDAREKRFLPFKANIEQQIKLVLNLAGEDDMVVLAFSGHRLTRRQDRSRPCSPRWHSFWTSTPGGSGSCGKTP